LIRHFYSKQFLTFVAVGGIAAATNWISRIALGNWMSLTVAVVVAYAIGMAVAFVLNRILVFPESSRSMHKQIRDFLIINLSFLPVVLTATVVLNAAFTTVVQIRFAQAAAHGIAVAIPAFATFLLYKFFAFRETFHAGQ
jgi:putative flippase GtrA